MDPRFGAELRRLRESRGLSLRQLAAAVNHGKSLVHQLETGRTRPTVVVASRLDEVLQADGVLSRLVVDAPDGGERLAYVAEHPRRLDPAAVRVLAGLLAGYRSLEDAIGSGPVLAPVRVQLDTVVSLLRDAPLDMRPQVVDVAAQWAQFAGWLGIAAGDDRAASSWHGRALQWASEVGNADLIATVLSFQGHQAEECGRVPAMIGLSRAARRDQTVNAALRAYCLGQEARGLAMAGACFADVVACLSEAIDVAAEAVESPLSPWGYWYTPAFFAVQQGIVWRYLGEADSRANDRAVELLSAGVAAIGEGAGGADWYGRQLIHLAVAQGQAGDRTSARDTLASAERIALATSSR
ncbi:multiprotein-bridging factor 1 family protein [Micromonospora sp. NPDC048830]|uniref:helix-turn-helix domain-containing protein n=1 Tax=Micromonospora sp. NPDC048830 TaxID=3364257 RepID=UPI003722421B